MARTMLEFSNHGHRGYTAITIQDGFFPFEQQENLLYSGARYSMANQPELPGLGEIILRRLLLNRANSLHS